MLRLFWVLIVFSLLGAGGYFGFRKWTGEERPVTYKTVPVARGTLISTVTATGSLEPLLNVLVGSQVSGTVIKWYADFNQRVEQGFILAELDQDRFKATYEQKIAAAKAAKARVEESRAALADAVLKREHAEKNFSVNAASDLELKESIIAEQQATATLHAAEADVERAEADARLSSVDVDRTVIRSPISGVVISRNIDEGQTVAASLQAPTLFTIANDLTKMRVNAAVSETDIGRIREGGPAVFRVDAYPERRFNGVISQVRFAQTTVDNVVTYTTMIEVDNSDLALRPGMTATISFEVARAENALLVPNAAMRFTIDSPAADMTNFMKPGKGRPMQPRVYKLVDGKPVEVNIQPGLTDGSRTEVKSGELKEDDKVITEQVGGPKPVVAAQPRRFGP
ncbi:MAG: efflux RND transporter periplasmic adaptor subunit [Planctomycetes bacterium]|nr:efflux RND transporter periplasmic adaptor subunit [Planctomycetota bacterium]MBI3836152.1 efflux RND transporter periplasmic adaptor subunit [Planctomycetota bacterium]